MNLRSSIVSSRSTKTILSSLRLLPLVFAILVFAGCSGESSSKPEYIDLVILHTNDIHGQALSRPDRRRGKDAKRGGFVALAQLIRQEREAAEKEGKSVLLLDGGDQFQGTPEGNITRGKIVTDFMNAAKYDACAIGNHEFDFGQQVPRDIARRLNAPLLGANVRYHYSNRVATYLQKYVTKDVGGVPVVIIGMTTSGMKRVTMAGVTKGLKFPKEEDTLKQVLGELNIKEKGQAVTILLGHLGVNKDLALAKKFPVLDVIVGGHSHTPIKNPKRHGPGKTLVAQAWDKTRVLGRIDVRIDAKTRKVVSIKGKLIPVEAEKLPIAKDVQAILDKYSPQIEAQMGEELGIATGELIRVRTRRSSPLGNFVTDAMRDATGAQVAFQNKPGIRSNLPAGRVTLRSIYEVSPFGNTLVTMTLTGAQIKAVMENSLDSDHSFLEISGMTCLCDSRKDEKVIKITVGGKDLDLNARYTVVTNSYISKGGDGANVFKKGQSIVDTLMPLRLAQKRLILKTKRIEPSNERRLDDLALPKD